MEKDEKKKFFIDFIKFINVIEFPNENDNPKRIHLLSLEEQKAMILVRKGILDKYKKSDRSNTYLSIGIMEYNNGDIKIRPNKTLQVPLKSISFYEIGEKA